MQPAPQLLYQLRRDEVPATVRLELGAIALALEVVGDAAAHGERHHLVEPPVRDEHRLLPHPPPRRPAPPARRLPPTGSGGGRPNRTPPSPPGEKPTRTRRPSPCLAQPPARKASRAATASAALWGLSLPPRSCQARARPSSAAS